MKPPEQHWKRAMKYEEAARKAKWPQSRKPLLRIAKRYKALAKVSLALGEPRGHG